MGIKLSPSRLSTFLDCGLLYKFKYVDKLGDTSGQAAVNGTAIHEALEYLYQEEAGQRTLSRSLVFLARVIEDWPKVTAFVPEPETCQERVWNLFDLEDPTTVNAQRTEMDMLLPWYDDNELRGIIDRVDVEGNDYVIVDYKSGKAPGEKYMDAKLLGVKFYAMMGLKAFGKLPSQVRLLFLGTPQTVSVDVTPAMARGIENKAIAAVDAIERGDFKAKLGQGCTFCNFKDQCPTWQKSLTAKAKQSKV